MFRILMVIIFSEDPGAGDMPPQCSGTCVECSATCQRRRGHGGAHMCVIHGA